MACDIYRKLKIRLGSKPVHKSREVSQKESPYMLYDASKLKVQSVDLKHSYNAVAKSVSEPRSPNTTVCSFKKAFIIGINYKNTPFFLGGCINDANTMRHILIRHYGYKAENILLLTDETKYKPNRENILAGWNWLLSGAPAAKFRGNVSYNEPLPANTCMYFHFSGHGINVFDKNNDEIDNLDDTLCPLDFLKSGVISDDETRQVLANRVPAGSRLVVTMDACHSGTNLDLRWSFAPTRGNTFVLQKNGDYPPTPGDVSVLSGSRDKEKSLDILVGGKRRGVLTYALENVLRKNNYQISYDDLLMQIKQFIYDKKLSTQNPNFSFGQSVDPERPYVLRILY